MKDSQRKRISQLIDDIAFFRDLENDYVDNYMSQELKNLEKCALELLNSMLHPEISPVNVAIIGNFSCGKSTFINSLIGKNLCPTRINPTTSSITKFIYGEKSEIFQLEDGEYIKSITHDEYFTICQHQKGLTNDTKTYELHYYYPFDVLKTISIFDTPGFKNRQNVNDQYVTEQIARHSDVVFLLLDVNNSSEIDADLESILDNISSQKPNLRWYYVLNRCDEKSSVSVKKLLNHAISEYGNRFDGYFAYSAKIAIDEYTDLNKNVTVYDKKPFVAKENSVVDSLDKIIQDWTTDLNIEMKKPKNSIFDFFKFFFGSGKKFSTCKFDECHKFFDQLRNCIHDYRCSLENISENYNDFSDSKSNNYLFLNVRQDILDTLIDIGRNKNTIKQKNFRFSIESYSDIVANTLEKICCYNKKNLDRAKSINHFNDFEEFRGKFNKIVADDIKAIIDQNAKNISKLLHARNMTYDEKSYVFTPYATISLVNDGSSAYLKLFEQICSKIDEVILEFENNFPYMRGKITQAQEFKDHIREKFFLDKDELNDAFSGEIREDYIYEDIEKAQESLEAFQEHIAELLYNSSINIFVSFYSILEDELKLLANTHNAEIKSKLNIFVSVDQKITHYISICKERRM